MTSLVCASYAEFVQRVEDAIEERVRTERDRVISRHITERHLLPYLGLLGWLAQYNSGRVIGVSVGTSLGFLALFSLVFYDAQQPFTVFARWSIIIPLVLWNVCIGAACLLLDRQVNVCTKQLYDPVAVQTVLCPSPVKLPGEREYCDRMQALHTKNYVQYVNRVTAAAVRQRLMVNESTDRQQLRTAVQTLVYSDVDDVMAYQAELEDGDEFDISHGDSKIKVQI